MADDMKETRGIVTLVCLTCGRENFYDQHLPKAVTCPQCQGTVFRTFATPTEADDATIAQLEEETRSLYYGDPSPGTGADDVRDLR